MHVKMSEEEIVELLDSGIRMYSQSLCMAAREERSWKEAEANFPMCYAGPSW